MVMSDSEEEMLDVAAMQPNPGEGSNGPEPSVEGCSKETMHMGLPDVDMRNKGHQEALGPKIVTVKVRNKHGGKNPQFGPCIRDAKKVAHGSGHLRNATRTNSGPSVVHLKENQHTNKKDPLPKGIPGKVVSDLVRELKDRLERLAKSLPIQPNNAGTTSVQRMIPFVDPNQLLGFIINPDTPIGGEDRQASLNPGGVVATKQGGRPSEPKPQIMSL